MIFALFDSTGNLIESYDDETEARLALERIVTHEPDAADHVAILRFDDRGNPVDEAIIIDASGNLVR